MTTQETNLTAADIKARGVKREDGEKDYNLLHPDGTVYKAIKNGQQFVCRGMAGSLKQLKELIAKGKMIGVETDGDATLVVEDGKLVQKPPSKDTFDCADPCALIVMFLMGVRELTGAGEFVGIEANKHSAYETLDCYGWITDAGTVDVLKATREMQRVAKRKEQAAEEAAEKADEQEEIKPPF